MKRLARMWEVLRNWIANPFSVSPEEPVAPAEPLPAPEPKVVVGVDPAVPGGDNSVIPIFQYIEGEGEAKILSISLWNEGRSCEHTYKRMKTTPEHAKAVRASGVHKDYVCTKCGLTHCSVIAEEAKRVASEWQAILAEKRGVENEANGNTKN